MHSISCFEDAQDQRYILAERQTEAAKQMSMDCCPGEMDTVCCAGNFYHAVAHTFYQYISKQMLHDMLIRSISNSMIDVACTVSQVA